MNFPAHLNELPDSKQAAKVAAERKAEAKQHFDIIKENAGVNSSSSMRIGWHAHYLKKNSLFGILGFEDEDEARKAAGVGESTWYANIRLAEAFQGITEAQFVSMKQANAKALSDLPESKRMSRDWIRMAGSVKIEEFADKCDEEMTGKAKPSDGKERSKVLSMPVPASRKKVIQEGLEEYAESIGIPKSDTGRALEMLVVEKTGQATLIQAITNANQHIKEAMGLKKSGLSADELLEKVYGILGDIALEFSAALDAARNGHEQKTA
jgi:hypothetical protein